jgi:hypothetical protein
VEYTAAERKATVFAAVGAQTAPPEVAGRFSEADETGQRLGLGDLRL